MWHAKPPPPSPPRNRRRGDPRARDEQIATYNDANSRWTTNADVSSAAAFRASGPFKLAVDTRSWVNFTDAAMEPVSVEQGNGISQYLNRTAFTTSESPFKDTAVAIDLPVVERAFSLYDQAGVTLWTRNITMAVLTNTSARLRGSAWSCRSGQLVGNRCLNSFFPGQGGICIVIDPMTLMYAGGCALSTSTAVTAWSISESMARGLPRSQSSW